FLRPAAAAELWADERLPVPAGLVLWLDASRQDRAYAAYGLPAVAPSGPLAVWFDASGRPAPPVQRSRDARPKRLTPRGRGAVHFDGRNQYLECAANRSGIALQEFTVFAYAAPASNPGDFRALLAVNEIARRDYQSGFTLDLDQRGSELFETLNVEGK